MPRTVRKPPGVLSWITAHPSRAAWALLPFVFVGLIGLAFQKGFFGQAPDRPQEAAFRGMPSTYGDLTADHFVAIFDRLIFSAKDDWHLDHLVRWEEKELTFASDAPSDSEEAEQIRSVTRLLSRLTRRSFVEVSNPRLANIGIRFDERRQLQPGEEPNDPATSEPACRTSIHSVVHPDARLYTQYIGQYRTEVPLIVKAWVHIRNDLSAERKQACIVEQLVRALGVYNDLPGQPSIFSGSTEISTLTETDSAVIRALYDSRLTSGMRRAQALKAVRAWFAEDRADEGR